MAVSYSAAGGRKMADNIKDIPAEIETAESYALGKQVYQQLLQQIIRLQLKPNEKINIAQLASDMDISRTPIRSAIERLVEDGLVEQISDRSYMVSPVSMLDCVDLCDARKILEGNAAYMASNNIKTPDIEILERSIEDAKACIENNDSDGFADYDALFHETLLKAADNHYLWAVYETIKTRMNRYRYLISYYGKQTADRDTHHALSKHLCILRAVKNRYSSVAQSEMEEHIQYTYRTLFELARFIEQDYNAKTNRED